MNYQNRLFIGLTLAVLLTTPVVDNARAAEASELAGIAFDRQGNLFVANHRYPENGAERIRCDHGTFARQHAGQPWLKSTNWGQTGSPADKDTTQKLEGWIKLVNAAFSLTPANVKADYLRAVKLDPNSVPTSKLESAYHNSGIVRFELGAYDAGIADLGHALELKPNDQDLFNDRGVAKLNQGDVDGVIADFNQAIAIDPKKAARAYRNRALVKTAKGDKEGAIADYNQAIELEPNNANAYNKRGELKRSKGDLDGAIADFTAAIGLDPKLALAYKNRGDAKQAKGDAAAAKQDFDRSEDSDSETEAPEPTPTPVVQLPAPEKGKVYGFQDLMLHSGDLAGKVVQVEVLPKAGPKTDLHDGRYCITLYDPKRVFGFVYCTKEGLQKMGFEDGTTTRNQVIYLFMKKDKLSGTISYTAVGTRFEAGTDGKANYSW